MNRDDLLVPLALLTLFAAACSDGKTTTGSTGPQGPNESSLVVLVDGAGTVTYDPGPAAPCSSDGSARKECPLVSFTDGTGTITATPAAGWRFEGWSTQDGSPTITQPNAPSITMTPQIGTAVLVTFVPLVHPIVAAFDAQAYSTQYTVVVDDPDLDVVKVQWSGPNCGDWTPQDPQVGAETTNQFTMTWHHPHPPCDATTQHKDVTVRATVTIKDATFVCEYQGADDGTGQACKPQK